MYGTVLYLFWSGSRLHISCRFSLETPFHSCWITITYRRESIWGCRSGGTYRDNCPYQILKKSGFYWYCIFGRKPFLSHSKKGVHCNIFAVYYDIDWPILRLFRLACRYNIIGNKYYYWSAVHTGNSQPVFFCNVDLRRPNSTLFYKRPALSYLYF